MRKKEKNALISKYPNEERKKNVLSRDGDYLTQR